MNEILHIVSPASRVPNKSEMRRASRHYLHLLSTSSSVSAARGNSFAPTNYSRRRHYGKTIALKEYVATTTTTTTRGESFPELGKHLVISEDDVENEPIPNSKNKVLVKVKAFSVNPLDLEVSRGYLDKFLRLGRKGNDVEGVRLGKDFSGEVVKIGGGDGENTTGKGRKFKIGDEVFGAISAADFKNGTMAEYLLVDRKQLMKKPKRLTHKEACAIPFAAYTAYACLRTTGSVDRKDPKRVLVFGGGSAVGECVARIALRSGFATTVVATAGKASEQMLKEEVGVDRVIGYEKKKKTREENSNGISSKEMSRDDSDSSSSSSSSSSSNNNNNNNMSGGSIDDGQNFKAKNSRFVNDAEPSFDVVIDTVGTSKTKFQATQALKKGTGTYITLHGDMAQLVGESGVVLGGAQASLELLREKTFARLQYDMGYDWGYANTNDFDATNLIEYLVDKGLLSVKIYDNDEDTFLGLESVERAFRALRDPSKKGKIVVEMP